MTQKWISVDDRLPESGRQVIAFYRNCLGKRRWIMAFYAHRWREYADEADEYFLCRVWYEVIDNWDEWSSIAVNEGTVTHWMPLPAAPGETPR